MREPDAGRFTYWYDGVGQITRLLNPFSENTTFTYDIAGRRTMQKLANRVRASYSYDAADRLTTLANVRADGTYVSRYDYAYDNTMNKTRVIEANGDRVTWSYDNTYQLTRERRSGAHAYDTTYVYDQAQNRKLMIDSNARTTYTCDAANQLNWLLDGTGRTTFTYDQNGNQTLELVPALTRTTNVWDGENRLIQVKHSTIDRCTYTYKGENSLRLVAEEPSAATSKFIWDGQIYLLETNPAGVTQASYSSEPTQYGNLVSQSRSAVSSFYHADSPGSITEVTNSTGLTSDIYRYKAFGESVATTGSTMNPFRFIGTSGYYIKGNTYYVRIRWFSPTNSRWLSIDVISNYDAYLPYLYSENNPTDMIDPSGLQCTPADHATCLQHCQKRWGPRALGRCENVIHPGMPIFGGIPPRCIKILRFIECDCNYTPIPGDCTKEQHETLEKAKNTICNKCRSCAEVRIWTEEELLEMGECWEKCAAARKLVDDTCFDGGNKGHKRQQQDARKNAARCLKKATQLPPTMEGGRKKKPR